MATSSDKDFKKEGIKKGDLTAKQALPGWQSG
jgi:hypothetical protein